MNKDVLMRLLDMEPEKRLLLKKRGMKPQEKAAMGVLGITAAGTIGLGIMKAKNKMEKDYGITEKKLKTLVGK